MILFLSSFTTQDHLVRHMQKHSNGQESINFIKYVIDAMQKVREREAEVEAKRQREVWKNVKHEILIAEEDMAAKLKKITNEIDELKTEVKHYKEKVSKEKKRRKQAEKKQKESVNEAIELNDKVRQLKRKLLEEKEGESQP